RSANVAQKPAWRFVEAWIPRQATMRMATVSRGALYAVLILALALLLAVAAFVVGQQHRLPPTVGLAANGLIADDSNGQIRRISPTGDVVRTITDSRVIALAPAFSADGQKLAYWSIPRTVDLPLSAPIDDQWAAVQDSPASLMVVNVDGGSPTAIATNVDVNNPGLQWSHAGDVIAYEETFATDAHANVVIASTTGAAPSVKISLVATPVWSPDDKLLALSRPNQGLFVVDRDGNNLRPVGQAYGMDAAFGWPDCSPDGSKLVYFTGAAPGYTVHTINIEGSGDRLIAAADGDIWA